jgi:hypothetical protein
MLYAFEVLAGDSAGSQGGSGAKLQFLRPLAEMRWADTLQPRRLNPNTFVQGPNFAPEPGKLPEPKLTHEF